jgi:hypothetical protein
MKKLVVFLFFLATITTLFSQNIVEEVTKGNQMYDPKYCLFYDNNTMSAFPGVGEAFDVEAFTDRIKRCGVDYLTFHARCDQGMAYYYTKTGTRHPSLKYDLFGKLAESCKRKGIALTAYFNGGISSDEGLHHREWTTLSFDGRGYREPRFTPYVRTMCYNTPYRDHLIEMVKEIAENYPISGIFIDCMGSYPCICPVCVKEMKERGIDWNDLEEVTRFSEFSLTRLSKDIAVVARSINPHLLLYFSETGYEEQADFGTYLECIGLPTGGYGYEFLPVMSHYMRTLGSKPVLNMTGRFYEWGDFGGLRPEAAIKSELLYGLANGMRPDIGGQFHPRGDMENAVLDRIEKIYTEIQKMEPWFNHAKNITEIAIVYRNNIHNIRDDEQLRSAVRMLSELKQQFDVVTEFSDWSKYKLLVIPDDILFTEEISRRVKNHINAGRAVISSGSSGLNQEKSKFVLEKEWGLQYEKECDYDPVYFKASGNLSRNLPDMPISLYSSGIEAKTLPGTSVGAYLIKPYFNRGWNGEYAFYYNPPDKTTDIPALTINGKVAHFSHRIFSGYSQQAPVELRHLLENVLDGLLPEPLLRADNLPSFSRAFVTEQPGRRMVHILSYIPELRGKTQMIEEPIELYNIHIALRNDNRTPKKVYLAPVKKALPFNIINGYINITIPEIPGYAMIVLEEL